MSNKYEFYFLEDSLVGDDPTNPFFTAVSADEMMQKLNWCIQRDCEAPLVRDKNNARFCYDYAKMAGRPGMQLTVSRQPRYARVKMIRNGKDLGEFWLQDAARTDNPNQVSVPGYFNSLMRRFHLKEINGDFGD